MMRPNVPFFTVRLTKSQKVTKTGSVLNESQEQTASAELIKPTGPQCVWDVCRSWVYYGTGTEEKCSSRESWGRKPHSGGRHATQRKRQHPAVSSHDDGQPARDWWVLSVCLSVSWSHTHTENYIIYIKLYQVDSTALEVCTALLHCSRVLKAMGVLAEIAC